MLTRADLIHLQSMVDHGRELAISIPHVLTSHLEVLDEIERLRANQAEFVGELGKLIQDGLAELEGLRRQVMESKDQLKQLKARDAQ